MALRSTREALSRIFYQRCFWLFVVLLTLIGGVSFFPAFTLPERAIRTTNPRKSGSFVVSV